MNDSALRGLRQAHRQLVEASASLVNAAGDILSYKAGVIWHKPLNGRWLVAGQYTAGTFAAQVCCREAEGWRKL